MKNGLAKTFQVGVVKRLISKKKFHFSPQLPVALNYHNRLRVPDVPKV